MRYYYHKKVLTKIRGRKYAYKFNFKELEVQYGYYRSKPYPASKSLTESYAIPSSYDAFHYSDSINNFPAAMGFISNSSYGYPATMEFASNGFLPILMVSSSLKTTYVFKMQRCERIRSFIRKRSLYWQTLTDKESLLFTNSSAIHVETLPGDNLFFDGHCWLQLGTQLTIMFIKS